MGCLRMGIYQPEGERHHCYSEKDRNNDEKQGEMRNILISPREGFQSHGNRLIPERTGKVVQPEGSE